MKIIAIICERDYVTLEIITFIVLSVQNNYIVGITKTKSYNFFFKEGLI